MPKTDKRMHNFKSLEYERQERDRKRSPIMTAFEMRLGLAAFALIFAAADGVSDYFWFIAFALIIVMIVMIARRKRKRGAANPNDPPTFDARPKTPPKRAEPTENLDRKPSENYVRSKSFTDYTGDVDPWDIKDNKPPWEL